MGLLDPPAIDWRARPLSRLEYLRDLPTSVCAWDAGILAGANGSSVALLPDLSGNNHHATASANAPTLTVPGLGGRPTLNFSGTQLMLATARSAWPIGGNLAQPFTLWGVARASGSLGLTATRTMFGGLAATTSGIIYLTANDSLPTLYAGSPGSSGGEALADGAWHIWIGMAGTASGWLMVDGFLVGTAVTQSHGALALGTMGVGARGDSANPWFGDIAECGVLGAAISLRQAADLTAALNTKWAVGL